MARSVLLLLVALLICASLMIQDVDAKKRKAKKRRVGTILKDLENNVTALWKEVKQLSQPVHVHLHGDGHLMDPHHPHPHHDHDHDDHHSHHHQHNSSDSNANKKDADIQKEDKELAQADDDGVHGKEAMMMKKMKMRRMCKDCKHKKHHDHDDHRHEHNRSDKYPDMDPSLPGRGRPHSRPHPPVHHHSHHMEGREEEDDDDDEDDDEEGWGEKWKWMHGGRRGTHVHIHLHTGMVEEEEEVEEGGGVVDHRHPQHPHHGMPSLPQEYRYARCDVVANSALPLADRQNIQGTVFLRQWPGKPLEAKGTLQGFAVDMGAGEGEAGEKPGHNLRGLHGHELGDLSNGCNSLGGHLNPFGVDHGGPEVQHKHRHVGDFGNLRVEKDGTANATFTDDMASLFGSYSMLGRSMVIHAGPDDLGHGQSQSSKASGNAGKRIACCLVVASAKPADVW